MRFLFLIFFLLCAPTLVRAEQGADQVYAQAIEALKSTDCAKGAALLRQYKQLAADTLLKMPNFAAEIDAQIHDCDAAIIARRPDKRNPIVFQGDRKLDP